MRVPHRQIEDAIDAVDREPASLLDQQRDRIGLKQQPRPSVRVAGAGVVGVEADAAAMQHAEEVGRDRTDPARAEFLAARTGVAHQAILDIGAHRSGPVARVGPVDREFGRALGDIDMERCQAERAEDGSSVAT